MKRISIALTVVACLAASASVAEAQVTTSQTSGPNGYSASRTVHRGNMTVTRSMFRGVLGLHGCNTRTNADPKPFPSVPTIVRQMPPGSLPSRA